MVLAGLILLSSILIVISFLVVTYAEKKQIKSIEYNLTTLLSTTHQRLDAWVQYELSNLETVDVNRRSLH